MCEWSEQCGASEWVSSASEWANGGANGLELYASITHHFYPMWSERVKFDSHFDQLFWISSSRRLSWGSELCRTLTKANWTIDDLFRSNNFWIEKGQKGQNYFNSTGVSKWFCASDATFSISWSFVVVGLGIACWAKLSLRIGGTAFGPAYGCTDGRTGVRTEGQTCGRRERWMADASTESSSPSPPPKKARFCLKQCKDKNINV